MDLIHREVQEIGQHGLDTPVTYRTTFEITEAKVRAQVTLAHYRFYRAVEDINKTFGIFLIGITAHGRFINRDFSTTRCHQVFQFFPHKRQECFCNRITVFVLCIGQQSATEGIRSRYTGFQHRTGGSEFLQALELLNSS